MTWFQYMFINMDRNTFWLNIFTKEALFPLNDPMQSCSWAKRGEHTLSNKKDLETATTQLDCRFLSCWNFDLAQTSWPFMDFLNLLGLFDFVGNSLPCWNFLTFLWLLDLAGTTWPCWKFLTLLELFDIVGTFWLCLEQS